MQTQITDYHAKYNAYELSRTGGSGFDRLGRALFDACVDLNPHQIEAALFALRSPITKDALLTDEVGLGKLIISMQNDKFLIINDKNETVSLIIEQLVNCPAHKLYKERSIAFK